MKKTTSEMRGSQHVPSALRNTPPKANGTRETATSEAAFLRQHHVPTLRPYPLCGFNISQKPSRLFTWLDTEKIGRVVNQVNEWNLGRKPHFSDEQALYALQYLEKGGEIRIHGDAVFFPNAFHLIPVKLEPIDERDDVVRTKSLSADLPSVPS